MTKLVAITIILVAVSAVVGLRVEARDSDEVAPGLVTQELRVGGMQTPLCEMGVKRVLESLEGVAAVSVDRKHSRAEVTYDPALVSPVALARAVSAVGFSASLRGAESVAGPKAMAAHRVDRKPLTADEVDRVVTWVAAHVLDEGEIPTGSEIIEATGVQLVVADTPMIQQAVLMKLAEDPRGQALLEGSRCNDYGA
ncbi:MAG: heavy metal-associated domain-containing protein, partial [Acidobacteria bacterium]|nr:heavy metal-associated domain-containing protein [Acidobacteriota bacterium]